MLTQKTLSVRAPSDQDASKFVRKSISKVSAPPPLGPIADIACGFGRNAFYFARRGFRVYCLDNDDSALARIATHQVAHEDLIPISINLDDEILPFEADSLGGALCVYSWRYNWCDSLILKIRHLIRPGGFILIETVAGRGQNYLDLPRSGYIADQLSHSFSTLLYVERKAGPPEHDAVAVKALAIKI